MLSLCTVLNAMSEGKYSSEDFVICDVPEKEYAEFLEKGFFKTTSLEEEGFIHCAKPSQLEYVMNKFFEGDSYRLFISTTKKLGDKLKYEGKDENNQFPHLYRPFYRKDIIESMNIKRNEDGNFSLPVVFKKD